MRHFALLIVTIFFILMAGCERISGQDLESSNSMPETSQTTPPTTTTSTTTVTTTVTTTTAPPTQPIPPQTAPPENMDVSLFTRDANFESNIAFIGDSICSGFKVFPDILPANQVFAEKNIRTDTIYNYKFTYNNVRYNIVDCIATAKPKNIYIWMGINGINFTSKESYANNLAELSQKLLSVSPESKITILSMSPTTATHPWQANGKIQECNNYTQSFLEQNYPHISYINIYNILCDENGYLQSIYAAKDGVHLQARAYIRILSYLAYEK